MITAASEGTESASIGRTALIILALAPAIVALAILPEAADSSVLRLPLLFVLAMAVAASSAGVVAGRLRSDPDLGGLLLAFAGIVAAGGLSLTAAQSPAAGASELGRVASCGLIAAVVSLVSVRREGELIVNSLMLLAAVLCGAGLLQLVPGNPLTIWHEQTLASTLGNASFFAGWLAGMLPVALAEAVGRRSIPRYALAVLVALLAGLTGSRGAWIGAAAGLVLTIALMVLSMRGFSPRRMIAFAGLLIVAATGVVVFVAATGTFTDLAGPVSSLRRRFFFYDGAWNAFLSSPLLGNGAGNFRYFLPLHRSPDYWTARSEDISEHAHNEFLEVLSETGIVGIVAVGILFLLVVRRAANGTVDRAGSHLFAGCAGGLFAMIVDSLVSTNLRTVPVSVLASVLTGLLLAAGRREVAKSDVGKPDVGKPVTTEGTPVSFTLPRFLQVGLWASAATGAALIGVNTWSHSLAERHMFRANLLRWNGDVAASIAEYRLVLAGDPRHSEARLYLATNLIQAGAWSEATAQTDTIFLDDPGLPKARLVRAIALMESGDLEGARQSILDELKIARTPQALYYCALIHARSARPGDAALEKQYLTELVERSEAAGRDEYVAEAKKRLEEIGGR